MESMMPQYAAYYKRGLATADCINEDSGIRHPIIKQEGMACVGIWELLRAFEQKYIRAQSGLTSRVLQFDLLLNIWDLCQNPDGISSVCMVEEGTSPAPRLRKAPSRVLHQVPRMASAPCSSIP
jgi:hypothetical protein